MPKKKFSTKTLTCPECGKICNIMGYKNHIRLKHKIKVTEQINVITIPDKQEVQEMVEQVMEASGGLNLADLPETIPIPPNIPLDQQEGFIEDFKTLRDSHDEWGRQSWEKMKALEAKYGWVKMHFYWIFNLYREKYEPEYKTQG